MGQIPPSAFKYDVAPYIQNVYDKIIKINNPKLAEQFKGIINMKL